MTEKIEITYFYWDKSGHQRTIECIKGSSIISFLELVQTYLDREFREMQNLMSDTLLYVKEDLIIPQDIYRFTILLSQIWGVELTTV